MCYLAPHLSPEIEEAKLKCVCIGEEMLDFRRIKMLDLFRLEKNSGKTFSHMTPYVHMIFSKIKCIIKTHIQPGTEPKNELELKKYKNCRS